MKLIERLICDLAVEGKITDDQCEAIVQAVTQCHNKIFDHRYPEFVEYFGYGNCAAILELMEDDDES